MKAEPRVVSGSQSAYERWELPAVGETNGGPEPARDAGPLTAAQLEALHAEAYAEGRAEGRKAGFEEGRQEGLAKARAEMAAPLKLARGLVDLLARPLEALDEEVEQALVHLAVTIARQLVRRELRTDPGQVVAAVREAVSVLPTATRSVRLHLHPEDLVLVREALSLDGAGAPWELVEDPVMSRGGCRVVSETSRVDASVESRLAAVIAQVLGGERERDAAAGSAGGPG